MFDPNDLERLVSNERFGTYVTECSGDRERELRFINGPDKSVARCSLIFVI